MAGRGKTRAGGVRTAAIAVSAVFHGVLLVLLVRYASRTEPALVEPPVIQASLVPPASPGTPRRDRARPSAPEDRAARARTRPEPEVQAAASPPPGDVAPFTMGDSRPEPAPAQGPAPVLRGLGGCARADLTRREREDCEARRWADAAPANPRLNLDLTGRYAKNPEPFLSRRPSKGCRARLAGDVDGMGNDMNARAGITCVKPF
ncbi:MULTISPECIES: hypothetical protein [unclassified Caulobacter]|uniref:hypothetical protein n=1 Tax=unclassified Caulobacter TaxID=2648921 RepID=UPI0004A6DAEF|nr:hypothetical protein [Caulobacter sp. UNC358MFTsu5.1]